VSLPRILLHAEGGALLVAAVLLYWDRGDGWLLFAVLLLAPDLGMLGYLANTRVGAVTYDLLHTTVLPIGLALYGFLGDHTTALSLGLIWLAHIGMDRLLGYGLKYTSGFKDTHLGRV
jgi:hypothetical protein